jgi:hypothetical protein
MYFVGPVFFAPSFFGKRKEGLMLSGIETMLVNHTILYLGACEEKSVK